MVFSEAASDRYDTNEVSLRIHEAQRSFHVAFVMRGL